MQREKSNMTNEEHKIRKKGKRRGKSKDNGEEGRR